MQSYELCSDMIDVVIDIECIYGYAEGKKTFLIARRLTFEKVGRLRVLAVIEPPLQKKKSRYQTQSSHM